MQVSSSSTFETEARNPFLSAALPTDLRSQNRVHSRAEKAVHPPVTPSKWQGSGVKASFSPPPHPVGPCSRLASLSAAPGRHTLAYPQSGLASVLDVDKERARRWQRAHLLDSIPISSGPQICPGLMSEGERVDRDGGILLDAQGEYASLPFPPSIFAMSRQGSCSNPSKSMLHESLFSYHSAQWGPF